MADETTTTPAWLTQVADALGVPRDGWKQDKYAPGLWFGKDKPLHARAIEACEDAPSSVEAWVVECHAQSDSLPGESLPDTARRVRRALDVLRGEEGELERLREALAKVVSVARDDKTWPDSYNALDHMAAIAEKALHAGGEGGHHG